MRVPDRGEVWVAALDPVIGREQGGTRPCVVVSSNGYNRMPIAMTIIVPLTARDRGLPHQPPITSLSSGLDRPSVARPEDVRSISATRLARYLGHISAAEQEALDESLRRFLDL